MGHGSRVSTTRDAARRRHSTSFPTASWAQQVVTLHLGQSHVPGKWGKKNPQSQREKIPQALSHHWAAIEPYLDSLYASSIQSRFPRCRAPDTQILWPLDELPVALPKLTALPGNSSKTMPEQPNSWLLFSFLLPSSKGSPSSTRWVSLDKKATVFVLLLLFILPFFFFFSWNLRDLPQQQHGADVTSAMGDSADLFSASFCTNGTENLLPSKGVLWRSQWLLNQPKKHPRNSPNSTALLVKLPWFFSSIYYLFEDF